MSDMSEFSTKRESSAGLPLSKRDEIHSFEVKGRLRLDGDWEVNAGDDVTSVGVRGRLRWAPALGSADEERLESGECNLRLWGDWESTDLFMMIGYGFRADAQAHKSQR
jgi:hypothetical protein